MNMDTVRLLDEVVAILKHDEGFMGDRYLCSTGEPTIGYGTLLPLTEQEATLLLQHRLYKMEGEMVNRLREIGVAFFQLPMAVQKALYQMAYQLGVPRLMGFRKMFRYIKRGEWLAAHTEALDSLWARQTPDRAHRVSRGFLEVG